MNAVVKDWLIWTAGFLAFPLAGIAGEITGPVDSVPHALAGGLVTGLIIGGGQTLVARGRLDRRWIPGTALGMTVGLTVGARVVDFGHDLGDLALMGAVTGVALGVAQALALPTSTSEKVCWAAGITALWPLGWTVTTLVGVDVDRQYTVFGSTGAITVSALSGVLLLALTRSKHALIGEPA